MGDGLDLDALERDLMQPGKSEAAATQTPEILLGLIRRLRDVEKQRDWQSNEYFPVLKTIIDEQAARIAELERVVKMATDIWTELHNKIASGAYDVDGLNRDDTLGFE